MAARLCFEVAFLYVTMVNIPSKATSMITTKNLLDKDEDIDNKKLYLITGSFLDSFRFAKPEDRSNMIKDEPDHIDSINPYARAMIAGMVEWLCNQYGLETKKPDWIMKDKYYLDEPHYALNAQGDFRYALIMQSPPELSSRNIFTTYNVFHRV